MNKKINGHIWSTSLLWLPSSEDLQELKSFDVSGLDGLRQKDWTRSPVWWLRKSISDSLGIKVVFREVKPVSDSQGFHYASTRTDHESLSGKNRVETFEFLESLYCISCELQLESLDASRNEALIYLYCSLKKQSKVPDIWLTCDFDFITGKDSTKLEDLRSHSSVELKSFSLGNFVGLKTFVQHLDSSLPLENSSFKLNVVKGEFKHLAGRFILYFMVGDSRVRHQKKNATTHRFFKLVLQYSAINRIILCNESKKNFVAYFQYLDCPLLFEARWRPKENDNDDFEENAPITYSDLEQVVWVRTIELYDGCSAELKREFAMNYTLQLNFKDTEYKLIKLLSCVAKHINVYLSPVIVVKSENKAKLCSVSSKYYDSFYALKCILTRSHELIDQLEVRNEVSDVSKYLAQKCTDNSKSLASALIHVYNAMDKGHVVIFTTALKDYYEKVKREKATVIQSDAVKTCTSVQDIAELDDESKIIHVKRAVLTPTHVRFFPPQPSLYNRMLKDGTPEYFLRVNIRDINLVKINFTTKCGKNEFQRECQSIFFNQYIKQQVLSGIKLGNRKYEFLGASTSQLKSHSFWCYAKDEQRRTAADIRKKCGDLDDIPHVPKFMARMGLSFSQSMGYVKVPQKYTNINNPEKDIVGGKKIYLSDEEDDEDVEESAGKKFLKGSLVNGDGNGAEREEKNDQTNSEEEDDEDSKYTFSDGIGRMSSEIAKEIYKELKFEEEEPSAVQIRYAGCKGMLVVDPTLEGKRIVFRESMQKIKSSSHDALNILKISKPRTLFLNRPLIMLLEFKGIKKDVFVRLQKQMVHSLIKSMFHDEEAMELLDVNSKFRLDYKALYECGVSFTEDPFFRSMILAIFRNQIHLLKTKARIALPEDKARNMFGVLDETKTLEYNQVFVQYTVKNSTETKILEGCVVVTKSPCVHPGDVRKFTAVNVEGLKHIKDCIVFPAKGPRPHPDEMAGSDLDGDEYAVIWLEDLIFEEVNSSPMHYAIPKAKHLQRDRPIDVSDQMDHFRNYILNDNVGLLANSHLTWADKEGPDSKRCKRIAKAHAKALDFAKTGRTAKLKKHDMAFDYPDFMDKKDDKKSYVSKKALGHLYRMCRSLEMDLGVTTDRMEYRRDEDLLYKGWEKYESSAQKLYLQYSKRISSWIRHYGFQSEGELLSGSFIQSEKPYAEQEDMHNLLEILEFQTKWLMEKLEDEFYKEFGGKPEKGKVLPKAMLQKASAWYVVTYKENVKRNIFGLPWMVADVLAAIKMMKKNPSSSPSESSIFIKEANHVEAAIDKYIRLHLNLEHEVNVEGEDEMISFKMKALDSARNVLTKWLAAHKEELHSDIEMMEQCMDKEFSALSDKLLCCDSSYLQSMLNTSEKKKAFSPGHYVLETLIRISEMGSSLDVNAVFSDALTEFGRLAWITLIHLACSCSIKYLGLVDSAEERTSYQVARQDVISTVQVPLPKKSDPETDRIRTGIIWHEDVVKSVILSHTKVTDLMVSWEKVGPGYVLKITLEGPRFAIEQLKEYIGQDEFFDCLIREVQIKEKKLKQQDLSWKKILPKGSSDN